MIAENFNNFEKLIEIVWTFEKCVDSKDHAGHRASCWPDVKAVVVQFIIDEQLRSFVISRGNTHVVLCLWLIVISKTPVDQPELLSLVIDDDI